jgi:fatty acid CoA ligase FadD9
MQWAAENGKESKDFAELVKDSTLSCAILADLIIVGRQAKVCNSMLICIFYQLTNQIQVQSYEIPRGLVLEAERFSAENNMLTPSFKLNRMALTKRYSLPLDNLYEQLSKRGSTVLIEAAKQDVAKLISQATGADLASLKGATEINLAELGVDSMSAIKLKNLFKNELGMNVTVDKLLGKASLDSLAEGIISGKETIEETIDWRAEASLPADLRQLIEESSSLPRIRLDSPVNGIFITGATGFLGAFIIAQLYEEYPEAKLFCLIRAKTAQEAKTRLAASLKKLRLSEDINKSVVPVCPRTFSRWLY